MHRENRTQELHTHSNWQTMNGYAIKYRDYFVRDLTFAYESILISLQVAFFASFKKNLFRNIC